MPDAVAAAVSAGSQTEFLAPEGQQDKRRRRAIVVKLPKEDNVMFRRQPAMEQCHGYRENLSDSVQLGSETPAKGWLVSAKQRVKVSMTSKERWDVLPVDLASLVPNPGHSETSRKLASVTDGQLTASRLAQHLSSLDCIQYPPDYQGSDHTSSTSRQSLSGSPNDQDGAGKVRDDSAGSRSFVINPSNEERTVNRTSVNLEDEQYSKSQGVSRRHRVSSSCSTLARPSSATGVFGDQSDKQSTSIEKSEIRRVALERLVQSSERGRTTERTNLASHAFATHSAEQSSEAFSPLSRLPSARKIDVPRMTEAPVAYLESILRTEFDRLRHDIATMSTSANPEDGTKQSDRKQRNEEMIDRALSSLSEVTDKLMDGERHQAELIQWLEGLVSNLSQHSAQDGNELADQIAAQLSNAKVVGGGAQAAMDGPERKMLKQENDILRDELERARVDSEVKSEVNTVEAKTLLLLEERASQLQADLGEKEGQIELFRSDQATLEVENETIRRQMEVLKDQVKHLSSARKEAQQSIDLVTTMTAQLEASERRNEKLAADLDHARNELHRKDLELVKTQAQLEEAELHAWSEERIIAIDRLEAENFALREILNELTRKFASWETEVDRDAVALLCEILTRLSRMRHGKNKVVEAAATRTPTVDSEGWWA